MDHGKAACHDLSRIDRPPQRPYDLQRREDGMRSRHLHSSMTAAGDGVVSEQTSVAQNDLVVVKGHPLVAV